MDTRISFYMPCSSKDGWKELLQPVETALNRLIAEDSILIHGGNWHQATESLAAVPALDYSDWAAESGIFNNCYNFALNWRTDSLLQIGDIFLDKKDDPATTALYEAERGRINGWDQPGGQGKPPVTIDEYANYYIALAKQDGLIQIDGIKDAQGGYPVALFFRETPEKFDYHWACLRRINGLSGEPEIFSWAHKLKDIRLSAPEADDLSSLRRLFSDVAGNAYNHFAGFFKVDPAILMAKPGGLIERQRQARREHYMAYY